MREVPGEKEPFSVKKGADADFRLQRSAEQPSKSVFSQLFSRIKKTFQPAVIEDSKLSGRVQQLNQTAVTIMQKLKDIKELLKDNLDCQLFTYVELLMDPMTRDVASVQKLLSQEGSVVHQAKAFKKYSNWMIKAELWIELESKVNDTDAITKAIISHIMHEADEQIDQDLQVIRDYEEHILDTLPLNDEESAQLRKHLGKEIRPQMAFLEDLKEKPELNLLQDVLAWKDDVDKKRSKYFDRALQLIDEIIHAISPGSTSEEEHDHLVEVLTQIAYLEEEIPVLVTEVESAVAEGSVRQALLISKVQSFEQELHELNLNLRLTPELVERLQILMNTLKTVSDKLFP